MFLERSNSRQFSSSARPAGRWSEISRRHLLKLSLLVGATLVACSLSLSLAHAETPAPDAFVSKISTEVLDKIRQDRDVQSGNPAKVSEFVDTTIMPVVNFQRMTALAVGRSWRQATPEQKDRLMAEFRTLLVRTYSGALASVGDQKIRMKPFRGNAQENEVIVRSEVVANQGEPIQLDYRLEKAGDAWKIYDLNVMGVWLVDNYRNQFSQEINAKGIDGLIQSLADKNKQAAGGSNKS